MNELDEALAAWGADEARLINQRENAVYEVRIGTFRAALRLHRPGYQSAAAIRSEIVWMRALAEAGLDVPDPVPAADGALVVALADGRLATAVSWVEGAPLGAGGEPLPGSETEQLARFHAVGRAVARLHNVTDRLTLPDGFTRHAWDIDGFLGETPFWGRFWDNPALTGPERDLILAVRDKARAMLTAFAKAGGDFGLIHADVLRENVIVAKDARITLIDFDDSGWGFRLYDLATLMSQNEGLPNSGALRDAAVAGYRAERPLADADVALLPMFVMLRRFASMGWIASRVQPGEGGMRVYAERGVNAAEAFLSEPV